MPIDFVAFAIFLALLTIEFSSFIGEWPEREREDSTFSAAMEDILVLVAKVARHGRAWQLWNNKNKFL